MSVSPGPTDAVIARLPQAAAPNTAMTLEISSPSCWKTPPCSGRASATYSSSSVCGVIG